MPSFNADLMSAVNDSVFVQWIGRPGVGKTSANLVMASWSERPCFVVSNAYTKVATGYLIRSLGMDQSPATMVPVSSGKTLGGILRAVFDKLDEPSLICVDSVSGFSVKNRVNDLNEFKDSASEKGHTVVFLCHMRDDQTVVDYGSHIRFKADVVIEQSARDTFKVEKSRIPVLQQGTTHSL